MSSFKCDYCGADILDSPDGYTTECEHWPLENLKSAYVIRAIKYFERDMRWGRFGIEKESITRDTTYFERDMLFGID